MFHAAFYSFYLFGFHFGIFSFQFFIGGGEWKYLHNELCAHLTSYQKNHWPEINYTLADVTGDGFPEMIMTYGNTPDVIYYYSDAHGIGMECLTSYFEMTIYQNGIVEYASGGKIL